MGLSGGDQVVAPCCFYRFAMFGSFQQTSLRIEIKASEAALRAALTEPAQLKQWLFPAQLSGSLTPSFEPGQTLVTWLGPVPISQTVDWVGPTGIRFLLSQGIDGFHEWTWGDGWVQSRLEGVSLLPLSVMQTGGLLQLRHFLGSRSPGQ
jgi:hypothetical protein